MGSPAAIAEHVGAASRHDVPSLDGLRAVSIAIVILSHTKSLLPAALVNSGLFRYSIGGGLHGVQVFFVISGYLITTLLLREFDRTGDISLRRFYARRTLRIFPPFYIYLGVLAALWVARLAPEDPSTFLAAATCTIIYHPNPQGWLVEHAWSLSIEEQFYLLWPLMLLIAYRRKVAVRVAISVLSVMPILRAVVCLTGSHAATEHSRLLVNSGAIDMLMIGCLLALVRNGARWQRWFELKANAWLVIVLLALGLVIVPYAAAKLSGSALVLVIAFGYTITALAIGALLEYVVRRPRSIAGSILNRPVLRHLGVISYSLYLWQQLFTANPARFGVFTCALILAAAELSFWIVERPVMRLRARLLV
ncbi:MAG TPA: acyltransferase [Terracidiphilus sp.]|nr:acyltransferase [Terracidiphilus sp.]